MADITNVSGNYSLDFLMIPSDYISEFNDFMTQYGELDDYDLFQKIIDTKKQLSPNLLNQHLQNLDALSQMNGFVTNENQYKIQMVKEILTSDTGSKQQTNLETQFFGGTSLFLWFLILSSIWRRPYYRRPHRRHPGFF